MIYYKCNGGQPGMPVTLDSCYAGLTGEYSVDCLYGGDYLFVTNRDLHWSRSSADFKDYTEAGYSKTVSGEDKWFQLTGIGNWYLMHTESGTELFSGTIPSTVKEAKKPSYLCYRLGNYNKIDVTPVAIVPNSDSLVNGSTTDRTKKITGYIDDELFDYSSVLISRSAQPANDTGTFPYTGYGTGITIRSGINDGGRLSITDHEAELLCVILSGDTQGETSTSTTSGVNPAGYLSDTEYHSLMDFVSLQVEPGTKYVTYEDRNIPGLVVWFCKFLEPVSTKELGLHISCRQGSAYVLKFTTVENLQSTQ